MAGAGMAGRAEEDGQQKAQARGIPDEQVDVGNEGGHQESLEEGEIVDTPPESEDEANRVRRHPKKEKETIFSGYRTDWPRSYAAPPYQYFDRPCSEGYPEQPPPPQQLPSTSFFLEISLLWRSEHCVDKCPYLGKRV